MAYDVECAVFLQFVRVLWTVPVGFFRRFFSRSISKQQKSLSTAKYFRIVSLRARCTDTKARG